ncbi:hypothetical protein Scep_005301 [Stephania cephalantha]|uniref:Uncharacterized protein n=1 Tax=Stephania cephalantha TaxID=152367 RepID=A0AAP0KU18_9MAGN
MSVEYLPSSTLDMMVHGATTTLQVQQQQQVVLHEIVVNESHNIDSDDDEEQWCCVTPTSKDQKIPILLSCPPAPKKPKRSNVVLSCKRKLLCSSELQFFESTTSGREQVDSFFKAYGFGDSNSTSSAGRIVSGKIKKGN